MSKEESTVDYLAELAELLNKEAESKKMELCFEIGPAQQLNKKQSAKDIVDNAFLNGIRICYK